MIDWRSFSKVFIVSANRPLNVPKMNRLVGDAVWVVPFGQKHIYSLAGAKDVVEVGGLIASRNYCLTSSFVDGKYCVMLSDDLTAVKKVIIVGGEKKAQEINFEEAVSDFVNGFNESKAKLGGVAPTSNPYFYHQKITKDGFIVGDFTITKPCHLLYDEKAKVKEDYDYTLQHLTEYEEVYRDNSLLFSFKHMDNHGGAVDYRTNELEQSVIAYLISKWGDKIRINNKRENQILLTKRTKK